MKASASVAIKDGDKTVKFNRSFDSEEYGNDIIMEMVLELRKWIRQLQEEYPDLKISQMSLKDFQEVKE